jgi:D-alanyl-lipoteichoic acid acyltransferase DltB (MBOAT superfamily)
LLFPTLTFAVFFAVVYPLNWMLRRRPLPWKLFMLGASYLFYSAWDARFVLLLVASTVVNCALGFVVASTSKRASRLALVAAVGFDLALLGVFKYYGFFAESLNSLALRMGVTDAPLPYLEILLPVGISFFTYQSISYVVDLYRREIVPASFLDYAVYLAFFPHLVAGPIVRGSELLPQIRRPRSLMAGEPTRAAVLIGSGLFKKVVVSSYLAASIVDPVFANPASYSSLDVLAAVYGYAIQIYADFSGYTDIAIGIALLLGFRLPENFARPYGAASASDFWRRWHMTLSRWLRDYLYIPLGGSRVSEGRTYANLLVTMTLGGLWHGAAVTFVLWGIYHGVGLIAERWFRVRLALHLPRWVGTLLTFHFVCFGWILFRAETPALALAMIQRLVTGWGPALLVTWPVAVTIAAMFALQQVPLGSGRRLELLMARLPWPVQGGLAGAWLAVCVILGPAGVAPFIYFRF